MYSYLACTYIVESDRKSYITRKPSPLTFRFRDEKQYDCIGFTMMYFLTDIILMSIKNASIFNYLSVVSDNELDLVGTWSKVKNTQIILVDCHFFKKNI